MDKRLFIILFALVILLVGGYFAWQKQQSVTTPTPVVTEPVVKEPVSFVTDVDPNVDHWQTKETEFFTIKFPKEWYWLESDLEKTGYHSRVITNNPNFDIGKYADIAVFSGVGPISPITLVNTEILITDRGVPTSNAGTPSDSLDSIFNLAKYNYPAANCFRPDSLKTLPIIAHCSARYPEDQMQLSYYVIDKYLSLTLTLRKRGDSDALQSVVEKIARSIQIKH